ncbi:MAG: hypothetical protein K1X53_09235 [Candidatus Sumerlaeaceae bacterium]|nr:hypothetical protein [Candidatus Sumerlaeaceae bacterium]
MPTGNVDPTQPCQDPSRILSLGTGGSITLAFDNNWIVNGPGPDFTIFENPFQPVGFPDQSFAETAIVSVSEDGTTWTTIPYNFVDPGTTGGLLQKSCYSGLAGLNAVYSNPSNGISAYNPAVSGGDAFDLTSVGLTRTRFIRLTDTGTTGPTQIQAPSGSIINDYGNALNPPPSAGFDLNAVVAIHTSPRSASVRREDWELYE